MTKIISGLKFVALLMVYSSLVLGEVTEGKAGSIVLRDKGREIVYENVVGMREGFYQILTSVNGSPALWASLRDNYFITLIVGPKGLLIDCAYADVRNIYNGAKVYAGMCGLHTGLNEKYVEIAQGFSNKWTETIFSFDTRSVIDNGVAENFFLGKIGSVEVYDRYPSWPALERLAPQKYIRSDAGCFNFGGAVGYLVFINPEKPQLKYLDILRSEDPMRLERMGEQSLKKLAVEECI